MTSILLSSLGDGDAIAFDPSGDVLEIDNDAVSAAQLEISYAADLTQISLSIAGKTFTLPPELGLLQLGSGNFLFADGSKFLIGTNADDTQLQGSPLNDHIIGLDGSDTLV
ncbi:MAG TPA: hypothetical protein VN028_02305, partial [Rhodocyclaceae bacterium]|nr:hypothetical protein [Rhodocyclaceae bacterium]